MLIRSISTMLMIIKVVTLESVEQVPAGIADNPVEEVNEAKIQEGEQMKQIEIKASPPTSTTEASE
jgi:hypothetical protein